jgi:hypothetical protein
MNRLGRLVSAQPFERKRVVQRVVFDADGKIAGLAYNPANMAVLPTTK